MDKEKTILIVDDIEINRAVLNEIFKDEYNTIEACNGLEALKILNSNVEISAMLLDLVMPEMNGFETLREMSRTGKIKVFPYF